MKDMRSHKVSVASEMLTKLEAGKEEWVYENYTEVYKEITFSAAHILPKHDRSCKYLHGHTYRVGVTLGGYLERERNASSTGMVIDFNELKTILDREVHERFDHAYLNEVMCLDTEISANQKYLVYYRPTAEQIAWFIYRLIEEALDKHMGTSSVVEKVDVWETPTSRATARRIHRT